MILLRKAAKNTLPRIRISQPSREDVVKHCGTFDQVEMLENHPDFPSCRPQLLPFQFGQVHAIPEDLSFRGIDQPVDTAQQCGFARAAETNDAQKLALPAQKNSHPLGRQCHRHTL
jgi:hypothetical protein